MKLQEHVSLATLTTFHTGGTVRAVVECASLADVRAGLQYAKEQNCPWYVLGEGSNVLPNDAGFRGVIIRMGIPGVTYSEQQDSVLVTAGAGVSWDTLVREVATQSLWGIENLAGIPGLVGAAPVQNIGAYGAELQETFVSVEVLNTDTDSVETLSQDACDFAYRMSRFKREPALIILNVTLQLRKHGTPQISYRDLEAAKDAGADLSTPSAIGDTVRSIRAGKFPDLSQYGTAGSFFKNPILSNAQYDALVARVGSVPQFPHPHGIKIPLAFVLDKILGLRNFKKGNAFLFGTQPLVLTLEKGGNASDIEALAKEVESRVFDAIGVHIEREVRSMPV